MIVTELKKLILQSELVSIERDCHDEALTGVITDINQTLTCMHLYTHDGLYDGFTIFETEQISEVFWGNREHKAINDLISSNHKGDIFTPKIDGDTFRESIIEISQSFSSICFHCHHDEDRFDIATIEKVDKNWFKLLTFGRKATLSRMYKIMSIESVSRIVVNSPYQNKIVALH